MRISPALFFIVLLFTPSAYASMDDLIVKASKNGTAAVEERAAAGDPRAQFTTGLHYLTEEHNGLEAAEWFRKSASQGYAAAQYYLASAYHTGDGLTKDEEEAYFWCSLAQLDVGHIAPLASNQIPFVPPEQRARTVLSTDSPIYNAEYIKKMAGELLKEIAPNITPQQMERLEKRITDWKVPLPATISNPSPNH